jgi:5-methylcytosine-specific restriction endonuclease McrA
MPVKGPRICGCSHVVHSGERCACERARDRDRKARFDSKRPSARERGYDAEWDRERAAFLTANEFCVRCANEGVRTTATIINHKRPHRGDRGLFWQRSNWEAVCAYHHNSVIQAEERRERQ